MIPKGLPKAVRTSAVQHYNTTAIQEFFSSTVLQLYCTSADRLTLTLTLTLGSTKKPYRRETVGCSSK